MNQDKINMISSYIEITDIPILMEQISLEVFPNAVVIEANCNISELNGNYEGKDFVAPKWYKDLLSKNSLKRILVINGIDKISKEEQLKFIELLKYKKISTFDIPNNTVIVLMASDITFNISPEISSLVATIKD